MAGDVIGAAVGITLAIAIIYSRHGQRISHAVMLAALILAAAGPGAMNVVALLAAFGAGYGYRVEREKARGR